jgi:hypothetical protein
MRFHCLGRKRKVLAGEGSWIIYRPLKYICPKCKKTITINPPFVKPRARITEEGTSLSFAILCNKGVNKEGV